MTDLHRAFPSLGRVAARVLAGAVSRGTLGRAVVVRVEAASGERADLLFGAGDLPDFDPAGVQRAAAAGVRVLEIVSGSALRARLAL